MMRIKQRRVDLHPSPFDIQSFFDIGPSFNAAQNANAMAPNNTINGATKIKKSCIHESPLKLYFFDYLSHSPY